MKKFLIRTLTSIVFVIVLVGCFFHPYSYALLFALITGMSVWEFGGIVNKQLNLQVNRFITTVAGVYLFLAVLFFVVGLSGSSIFIPYLVTLLYLLVSELYIDRETNVQNWAFAMMSQLYVALPFALLSTLTFVGTEGGISFSIPNILPLSVFFFLWCSDAGAYCVGSLIGKRKLFPRISPNKSWEGSIGGGVIAILVSQLLATFFPFAGFAEGLNGRLMWAGLSIVIVIFGTWGDLVESLIKRKIGIKDSGNILPGHGGMLDRFDSSLLAIPAAVIYIYTILLNLI